MRSASRTTSTERSAWLTIFAAAGNHAAGSDENPAYRPFTLSSITPGDYVFEWRFEKDAAGNGGEDRVWLANVHLPDGTVQRFDSASMPAGWSTSGNTLWQVVDDPAHSYGVGRYVARSGNLTHNQVTRIRSPEITVPMAGSHFNKPLICRPAACRM